MIKEEDDVDNLTMTYVGRLADVSGSNPSTGNYWYYFQDNIGSSRRIRGEAKGSLSLGKHEYNPFGEIYSKVNNNGRTVQSTH